MLQKSFVGIMFYEKKYKRIPFATGKFKKQLQYFEEAAKKNNVNLCFFRLSDIEPGIFTIKAYVLGEKGYELQTIPRPKVIYHRRVDRKSVRSKMRTLIADGVTIFNARTYDYGKLPIWKLLSKNSSLSPQLPSTQVATVANIKEMMKKYNSLIIKPDIGAVGRGLMKIERKAGKWCFSYTVKQGRKKIRKETYFRSKLPSVLKDRLKSITYIVQERINLATYNNNPFDIRVAVQRNSIGEWETTAFITKVAENRFYITNVSQGGKAYPLETILKDHPQLSYDEVVKNISHFCLSIAEHLSNHLSHIGCLGIDIGITADGTPYFIEVNYLSDFETLTFRNKELVFEDWKKVYTTPIDYAAYLIKKEKSFTSLVSPFFERIVKNMTYFPKKPRS
ncbi:YheC/YheD family protein [Salipaludibacillus daqingensis]|uniref:YheC/YheD family endospore coat-associated protein n=1 Tax=Salipaludibacillus daqingensis TaxID=3041001 RepID=UPI0024735037|nr:YheC/YheD family protein [Salipaludibacillus daqingensis]